MAQVLLEQERKEQKHRPRKFLRFRVPPSPSTLMKSISESNGYTALHWACGAYEDDHDGNAIIATLDVLLKYADKNDLVAVTKGGETPLMLAAARTLIYF